MSAPIQRDKPLTLNDSRSQGTSSTGKNSAGSATAASQKGAGSPQTASSEVNIELANPLYNSSTRQADAVSRPTITSSADANSGLEDLKKQVTEHPAQAMQAHGGISSEQAAALLQA